MHDRWVPIKPLDRAVTECLRDELAAVDALQNKWVAFAEVLDKTLLNTLRLRAFRRHAMETGLLERLYEIHVRATTTLVNEGFAREYISSAEWELTTDVKDMLNAQLEGLDMVYNYVQEGFPLTTSLIREVHALMTRSQTTYDATDAMGRPIRAKLTHGAFKTLPNNVKRPDGSLKEFAPPEQVRGEIENLVNWYNDMDNTHPMVSAAWLHHRFVQIHPFQDGNGRVARALTHYSWLKDSYMPATVDRHNREAYLLALDAADNDDLAPLVRLFIQLATGSFCYELENHAHAVDGLTDGSIREPGW